MHPIKRRLLLAATASGFSLAACAVETTDPAAEAVQEARQAMIGGRAATDAFTVSVNVNNIIPFGTGALIAPNLVLTSRVVVQESNPRGGIDSNCAEYGTNRSGLSVSSGLTNEGLKALQIPVVRIITDGSSTACDNDLAILELASPILDHPFARLRLDDGPVLGEPVRTLGWGFVRNVPGAAPVLQTADGTVVLVAGGPFQLTEATIDLETPFTMTSAPTCYGDQGGPVVDANANILSVTNTLIPQNYGTIDTDPLNADECQGAYSIGTALARHAPFIERTMQGYGLMPWRVGQAAPPGPIASTCTANTDCNSNLCIQVGGVPECSRACTQDAECGELSSCLALASGNLCVSKVQNPPQPSNCAVAKPGASHEGAFAAVLVLLGVAAVGRRRAFRSHSSKRTWPDTASQGARE